MPSLNSGNRCGVLLVNTGTPSEPRPRAIRKYLGQFLMDPHIRPMNKFCWWLCLHICIMPLRSHRNVPKYESIWTDEGSPFILDHEYLAAQLERQFKAEGIDVVVRHAMSYGDPSLPSVVRKLRDAGCARLVVLPTYPQSAYSTSCCVKDNLEQVLDALHWNVPHEVVLGYSDNPLYTKAIANSLLDAGLDVHSNDRVLFSFHSIPMADIESGDTYDEQLESSCANTAGELGLDDGRWGIGFQCQFDKGREWLRPFSREVLAGWAADNAERIFVVCPGFAVDCLETLYDINHEVKPYYFTCVEEQGHQPADREFTYVPCLNRSQAHIELLTDVLRAHLQ